MIYLGKQLAFFLIKWKTWGAARQKSGLEMHEIRANIFLVHFV